jgi:hypothetical protein
VKKLRLDQRARMTIGDLARLFGEDIDKMRRWLKREQVKVRGGGGRGLRCYVLLDDLREQADHIYKAVAVRD